MAIATTVSRLILLGVLSSVLSRVTEKKIQEFKEGIQALVQEAQNHTFEQKNFDPSLRIQGDVEQYDFIIIGAGAAGSVVANRLSKKRRHRVLLLEAGGPETPYTQIPKLHGLLHNTNYSWEFITTPQNHTCRGMVDNRCAIVAGKALGGGTAINDMYCTRGNPEDYNRWAEKGNPGWSYKELLPYFKRMENAFVKPFDPKYRHRGGPFDIENPPYWTEIRESSLAAGKELGFGKIDFNAKNQFGMGITQVSIKRGKRHSTAQAYLAPALGRFNLVIKPFSHVTKILINPVTKEAFGVEFLQNGKLHAAKGSKEVILSAGAVNTAQILKLSGIGPKDELHKFNISVVADLNVGKNFKDHVVFLGLNLIFNNTKPDEENLDDEVRQYLTKENGPLSAPSVEAMAFFQTEVANHRKRYPDIELFFHREKPSKKSFRLKQEIFDSFYKPTANKKTLDIGVMLLHPQSTGSVVLKDRDPLHQPLVDPNALSDPQDFHTLLAGVKKGVDFAQSEAFKKLNLVVNRNKIAGCENYEWGSDGYWSCCMKLMTISVHHVTGSAKMGPKSDRDAIVDHKLKVYGVRKLRVVDASVIPVTTSGHTMLPSIAIGEKASDLILKFWN